MGLSEKLMTRPIHTINFLRENDLLVEAHYPRHTSLPDWPEYEPFVGGFHLPYSGLNLAAADETFRRQSINGVREGIDFGLRYPVDRMVMHMTGIETDAEGNKIGTYENLIVSIRELCDYADEKNIILCLENTLFTHGGKIKRWGASPEEWFGILRDVERPRVKLTFDSSHAVSYLHSFDDTGKRLKGLYSFIARPELIGRIHWSDSMIYSDKGRGDMHLPPGKGDLPREFHQALNGMKVPKLLEQKCTESEVFQSLVFISSL